MTSSSIIILSVRAGAGQGMSLSTTCCKTLGLACQVNDRRESERETEGGHMMANEREGAIITLTSSLLLTSHYLPPIISSF